MEEKIYNIELHFEGTNADEIRKEYLKDTTVNLEELVKEKLVIELKSCIIQ